MIVDVCYRGRRGVVPSRGLREGRHSSLRRFSIVHIEVGAKVRVALQHFYSGIKVLHLGWERRKVSHDFREAWHRWGCREGSRRVYRERGRSEELNGLYSWGLVGGGRRDSWTREEKSRGFVWGADWRCLRGAIGRGVSRLGPGRGAREGVYAMGLTWGFGSRFQRRRQHLDCSDAGCFFGFLGLDSELLFVCKKVCVHLLAEGGSVGLVLFREFARSLCL
jgi:hypothetical protein